jgi:hypothetical protein
MARVTSNSPALTFGQGQVNDKPWRDSGAMGTHCGYPALFSQLQISRPLWLARVNNRLKRAGHRVMSSSKAPATVPCERIASSGCTSLHSTGIGQLTVWDFAPAPGRRSPRGTSRGARTFCPRDPMGGDSGGLHNCEVEAHRANG